jgi:hypothetical protein
MYTEIAGYLPGFRCPNCAAMLRRSIADLRDRPEFRCEQCRVSACAVLDVRDLDLIAQSVKDAAGQVLA